MAYLFGYFASTVFLGGSALTYYAAGKRARVATELTRQPVRTVEQATALAEAAGDDGVYLQVSARTAAASPAEQFKSKFAAADAVVSQTRVIHEFEDREVVQNETSTPLLGGRVRLGMTQSYGSWHSKHRLVDTQVRGKSLLLTTNGVAPQPGDGTAASTTAVAGSGSGSMGSAVRIRVDSATGDGEALDGAEPVSLNELYTEVAAPLLPAPTDGAAAAAAAQPSANGSGPVVNVINQQSASETFRTVGYRHRERVIRPARPVVALGTFVMADPTADVQRGADTTGWDSNRKYLTLQVPRNTSLPFVLSGRTRSDLIRDSEDGAHSLRVTSYCLLGIGLGLLGGSAYYHKQASAAADQA